MLCEMVDKNMKCTVSCSHGLHMPHHPPSVWSLMGVKRVGDNVPLCLFACIWSRMILFTLVDNIDCTYTVYVLKVAELKFKILTILTLLSFWVCLYNPGKCFKYIMPVMRERDGISADSYHSVFCRILPLPNRCLNWMSSFNFVPMEMLMHSINIVSGYGFSALKSWLQLVFCQTRYSVTSIYLVSWF